jgi:hypothetical protein
MHNIQATAVIHIFVYMVLSVIRGITDLSAAMAGVAPHTTCPENCVHSFPDSTHHFDSVMSFVFLSHDIQCLFSMFSVLCASDIPIFRNTIPAYNNGQPGVKRAQPYDVI